MNPDFKECSGNPASCPENEGYGCCMSNPIKPPIQESLIDNVEKAILDVLSRKDNCEHGTEAFIGDSRDAAIAAIAAMKHAKEIPESLHVQEMCKENMGDASTRKDEKIPYNFTMTQGIHVTQKKYAHKPAPKNSSSEISVVDEECKHLCGVHFTENHELTCDICNKLRPLPIAVAAPEQHPFNMDVMGKVLAKCPECNKDHKMEIVEQKDAPCDISDNELIKLMCLSAWGTESKFNITLQTSIMEDALDSIRPHLRTIKPDSVARIIDQMPPEGVRTKAEEWEAMYAVLFRQMNELVQSTKPISVSLEKGAAATYNDYFGGNNKWPDATDNERALYLDGTRATAKAWGLNYVD